VLLGAAAYAGFLWYQKRQDKPAEPTVVAQTTAPATQAPAPADTGTIVDVPTATETTATTATTNTATTVTEPPPAQPMTVTATAAPVAPPPAATTTTAAPATVEPLPVVTPKANGGRARYDEMARNYLANPQGNFTVQIQILCDPANLEKAMRGGGGKVWFVPQTIGGRACYRVFYGNFATRDEAQRALAAVPASLRDPSAAVKPVPGR